MLAPVALDDDLRRIADAAVRRAGDDEELVGIVPAEAAPGERTYLCAFRKPDGEMSWVVLDDDGAVVEERERVRATVSIAALCELAEELAGGGDLDVLRTQLEELRAAEDPPGIDEAQAAIAALQETIGSEPRVATPQHLDAVGAATRRLEQTLDDRAPSPFAEAMKSARDTVEQLHADVEANYKRELR